MNTKCSDLHICLFNDQNGWFINPWLPQRVKTINRSFEGGEGI